MSRAPAKKQKKSPERVYREAVGKWSSVGSHMSVAGGWDRMIDGK